SLSTSLLLSTALSSYYHSNSISATYFLFSFFLYTLPPPPRSTLFPYTTLFRSNGALTGSSCRTGTPPSPPMGASPGNAPPPATRSEEHTSELQSRFDLVCRLLLEKKKKLKTPV